MGSGVIQRGEVGTDISYTAAGERRTAQAGSGAEEVYSYDLEGRLASVEIGGVTRAQTVYDLLGRVTSYGEYDASGAGVHSRYGIVYDARGLVLAEKSSTRQGSDWIHTHTVNSYSDTGTGAPTPMISAPGQVGTSSGGLLFYSETKNWKNGGGATGYGTDADKDYADSYTSQGYLWRDGAVQSVVQLVNRDGTSSSFYRYGDDGALAQVEITGGSRPRKINYATSLQGQVLVRDEVDTDYDHASPHSRTYMFGGRQMGMVGNDGTGNVDYATSIAERTETPGTGPFRGGATSGTVHADFDANFTALNGGTASAGASSYVASAGETLQSIAAQLWGDASLWYLLAEANGLSGSATLAAGTLLAIPGGVIGNHHDAATFKPYDPAEAIGNTSPNTPKPPKAKNCGAFGAIMIAVVAIAISLAIKAPVGSFISSLFGTTGAAAGSTAAIATGIATGATVGAAASAGSQLYGMATGLQQGGFSWKGVALAGISGGVAGGLDKFSALSEAGKIGGVLGEIGKFLGNPVAAALAGNAISQGIGRLTGLQRGFDFAGFAAAGVGALAGASLGGAGLGGRITGIGADSLASAATRSLLTGTDFGDNILAVLPGVVARSLGEIYAEVVSGDPIDLLAEVEDGAYSSSAEVADVGYSIDDESIAPEEAAEVVVTAQRGVAQFRSYVTTLSVAQQELVRNGLTQGTSAPDFIVPRHSSEVPGVGDIPGGKSNPDATLAGAINEYAFFTAGAEDDLARWLLGAYLDRSGDGIVNVIERLDWETDGNDPMLAGNIAALHATGDPTLVEVAKGLEEVAAERWHDYGAAAAAEADLAVEEIVRVNPVIDDILLARDAIQGKASKLDIGVAVGSHVPVVGVAGKLGGRVLKAESRIASAVRVGKEGENLAGIVGRKVGAVINGRMRFPDELTQILLKEVKNVKYQGWTKQLQDYADLAKQRGIPFELWIRPGPRGVGTTVSRVLDRANQEGKVIFKYIGID